MVIYVPLGTEGHWDPNYHIYYDETFSFLKDTIGLPELREEDIPHAMMSKAMMGPTEEGIEVKLSHLKDLYDKGLINEKEYEDKKSLILSNLFTDVD